MDVEIKITGEWLQYSRKISEFQATQIIAFLSKLESRGLDVQSAEVSVAHPEQTQSSFAEPVAPASVHTPAVSVPQDADIAQQAPVGYESPRQAIVALGAKTNPQKIIAIAFYLGATSENGRLVTNDEILAAFAKAAEKTPKNLARDIKLAVADGYIFQESSTAFRLLSVTDRIAEEGFKKGPAKRRPTPKPADGARKPKLAVREEVLQMPISASLQGYMDFFDIKVRSDQVLWVVKYAKGYGIDGVNRQEIFHFSNKAGGDINSKNFTASNMSNIRNGYLSMEGEMMLLTAKGEQYMTQNLTA